MVILSVSEESFGLQTINCRQQKKILRRVAPQYDKSGGRLQTTDNKFATLNLFSFFIEIYGRYGTIMKTEKIIKMSGVTDTPSRLKRKEEKI